MTLILEVFLAFGATQFSFGIWYIFFCSGFNVFERNGFSPQSWAFIFVTYLDRLDIVYY